MGDKNPLDILLVFWDDWTRFYKISRVRLRMCDFFCTFEGTDLVRNAYEPTSKVHSHDVAHTSARIGEYVLFSARPFP